MAGWTPLPNELLEALIRAAKAQKDRPAALRAWLLLRTCRREGWDGLALGQIRITESEVASFLNCDRGNAHRLLRGAVADLGLCMVRPSIYGAAATAAPIAAPIAAPSDMKTIGLNEFTAAPNAAAIAAPSAAVSIYNNQESILQPPLPPFGAVAPPAEGGKVEALKVKVKRLPKKENPALPLSVEGGLDLDYYLAARKAYPRSAYGFNTRERCYQTRDVRLGSESKAQRYFKGILEREEVTSRELYACVLVATEEWKRQEYLWVPNFDTFWGPEVNYWASFFDRATHMVQEDIAKETAEAAQ